MLAGMFSGVGYFQGDDLYEPREANPKGFFENWKINTLNERIIVSSVQTSFGVEAAAFLKSYYRDGQYWLARLPREFRCHATEAQIAEIATLAANRPFAFKDPRFCYTLDAWMDAAPGTLALCIFRSPGAVVRSILHEAQAAPYLRDLRISVSDLYEGWRNMYLRVLDLKRLGREIFFLNYAALFSSETQLALESLVEAPLNRSFPEQRLERQRFDGDVDASVGALFDGLCELAALGFEAQTSEKAEAILQGLQPVRDTAGPKRRPEVSTRSPAAEPLQFPVPVSTDFVFSPSALRGLFLRLREDQEAAATDIAQVATDSRELRSIVSGLEGRLTALETHPRIPASAELLLGAVQSALESGRVLADAHARQLALLEARIAEYDGTIAQLRSELDRGASHVDQLLDTHNRHTEELRSQLAQRDQAIEALRGELSALQSARAATEALHERARRDVAELQEQVRATATALADERARNALAVSSLQDTIAEERQRASAAEASVADLGEALALRERELEQLRRANDASTKRIDDLGLELHALESRISTMLASKSWRLTAPLRRLRGWMP